MPTMKPATAPAETDAPVAGPKPAVSIATDAAAEAGASGSRRPPLWATMTSSTAAAPAGRWKAARKQAIAAARSAREPACQGSAVRFTTAAAHDRDRVLFCNPAGRSRDTLTVRLSYDECRSWNAGKVLQAGPAAYCDLAVAPDLTVLCLFERGNAGPYETLTLARFDLAWLTSGADAISPRS